MRKLRVILLTIGCVAALSLCAGKVAAQGGGGGGRGNFDPAQMRQTQLDRLKESLGVTDDGEWTVLSAAIGKVLDARTAVMAATPRGGGRGGAGGGRRGGGGGGGGGGGNADNAGGGGGGGRQRGGGMFGTPSAEVTSLQEAVDNKAPADEIKTKLAAVRAAQATADAALASAQDSLKKLLTSRQEAVAVLAGLLK